MDKSARLKVFVKIFILAVSLNEVTMLKLEKCHNLLNDTLVKTKAGWLEGKIVEDSGSFYYSYKGIPYAETPVGKLRFQAPFPKTKWKGVRPALEHGSYCANRWGFFGLDDLKGGSEDCLFLNVYTPSLQGQRSVMFFLHGGAMMSGNGDTTLYGPEHLMKEDVVLVTINYRYSSFGFLSTNDEHAPGNQGLKDMVLALKWVKQNIAKFGGDPNDVTIFGHSAGSAAVHFLIISDLAKGLFHKGIMQSGSSLMTCHFQPDPRAQAETLANRLNISFSNTKELIENLQAVDFQEIVNVEAHLFSQGYPWAFSSFEFVPSAEPKNTKNAFLTEEPIQRMIDGNFQKVPLMLGSPNFEGMFISLYFNALANALEDYNSHPNFLVPKSLKLHENSEEFSDVIAELQNLYFNDKTEGSLVEWLNVYSDVLFTISDDRVARFCAASDHPPIYYYEFAFVGTLNFFKKNLSLQNFEGASHGDELLYLFKQGIPGYDADEKSALIRNRMTKMWTNFAKYGNPTPEKTFLLPEIWNQYDLSNRSYFVIDEVLENRKNFPRMDVISDLHVKYTGHY